MKFTVILTIALSSFTSSTSTVKALQCRSYGQQVGECVTISRCPPFLAIILSKDKTREDIRMLQKLTCLTQSEQNKDPVVCCPLTEIVSEAYLPNPYFGSNNNTDRSASTTTTPKTVSPPTRTTPYTNFYPIRRRPTVPSTTTVNPEEVVLLQDQFSKYIPPLSECSMAVAEGDRIIGGSNTTHGMYPWMARLGYKNLRTGKVEYYCGGVIISKRYILTAGHCTHGYDDDFDLVHVRLGEHNTKELQDCSFELSSCSIPENVAVEKVITHPQYDTTTKHNDIALVRVARDIDFQTYFIRPICLPFLKEYGLPEQPPLESKSGIVAGWGRTNWTKSEGSSILQHVNLPIVPTEKCIKDFRNRVHITSKQLCAGGERNQDSCGGDSGGPLMVDVAVNSSQFRYKKKFQYGIVSYGPVKCGIGIPGVYTRVTEYLSWILKTMEP